MKIDQIRRGVKFFKFNGDEVEFIRVNRIRQKSNEIGFKDSEGKQRYRNLDNILSEYKILAPDGFISFVILKNEGKMPDILVALKDSHKITNKDQLPDIACRQMISDVYTNMTNNDPTKHYIGLSISRDTCPAEMPFAAFFACEKVESSEFIAFYLDDTLDDILANISTAKYDKVMTNIKMIVDRKNAESQCKMVGCTDSLKSLLTINNFMNEVRRECGIIEVPFPINEEDETLDGPNIIFLEKEMKVNIVQTYLLRYTREINPASIKRDFIYISSKADDFSKVYIMGFDKTNSEYIPRDSIY